MARQQLREVVPRLQRLVSAGAAAEADNNLEHIDGGSGPVLPREGAQVRLQPLHVGGGARQPYPHFCRQLARLPTGSGGSRRRCGCRRCPSSDPRALEALVQGHAIPWPLADEAPDELVSLAAASEGEAGPRAVGVEGVGAHEHDVEDHAQTPQVGSLVVAPIPPGHVRLLHLWGPVLRSAHGGARTGVPIANVLGMAKVRELDREASRTGGRRVHEDVLGLEVPVDYVLGVDILQTLDDLHEDVPRLVRGEPAT
mmetsp:Transcript_6104/g.19558  ORF Transcript_6104/g.19558 Transcript_6104/m.19558 type:complete len:255 (-) Transcript_6104:200-964(-)